MRRNQGGRKDIKMLLFADNIIIYLDKPTKLKNNKNKRVQQCCQRQNQYTKTNGRIKYLGISLPLSRWCAHLPNPYHNPTYQEIRFSHHCCCCLVTKSYPTLYNPMDCSLKGSSVHDIFPARILEWGGHFLLQGIFIQGTNPY